MKTSLSALKVVLYALIVEVGLLIIQFIYAKIAFPGATNVFSDTFMQNSGFFVFQIAGFFIFILLAQYVFKNSGDNSFRNAILLFFSGALVEIVFYLFIQASYQGAFLYSVMDKIVAIAFGLIIAFASRQKVAEAK